MSLVAPMPAYLALGGLQIVRLGLEEHDGVRDLVAIWSPLLPDDQALDPGQAAQKTVLAHDVGKFVLAYYGRESAADPPAWFDAWQDHAGLPKLIRVSVTFPAGDRAWPDLLVRPMIDLGAMLRQ